VLVVQPHRRQAHELAALGVRLQLLQVMAVQGQQQMELAEAL
jgi:hypothetical protein